MNKAVIFDLDGVLVSTDKLHFMAWKRIAEDLGINNFTETDNIRQRGVSRERSLDIVLEKSSSQYTAEQKAKLCEQKNDYYKQLLSTIGEEAVLAGAVDTIDMLHKKGIGVAVGSVSKNAPEILKRTGLIDSIDKVSCGLDITRSKPDPEVFLVAAKKLGIDPCHCLVVEDSDAGIDAAKAANMLALAVGAAEKNEKADFSACSLADAIDGQQIFDRL